MNDIDKRYEEATQWMFERTTMFQNVGADAYKPGLERVEELAAAFGNPHRKFPTIHVGGTNGKGSTSSLLASVMTESGRKTGLFTSPHLVDFRERMRIDGRMIGKEDVVGFIDRYRAMNLPIEPSFFELTTIMAFDWFAREGVDMAVIEVGLGGRLDSTNIISPLEAVITNISLDHTALLGDTPEKIAAEKAGIIKAGVPVVVGHARDGVREVFARKAQSVGAPIDFAEDSPLYGDFEATDTHYIYKGTPWGTVACPLTGDCQRENANTVLHALSHLEPVPSAEAVQRGFAKVVENSGLMGRWTTLAQSPRVVCDTGHNPGGWEWLGPRLKKIARQDTLRMVIGFVNDKDIDTILAMMPAGAKYYFTRPSVKRGRPAESLRDEAVRHGLEGGTYPDVATAYRAALDDADPTDTVFVGGSTFVVADLLTHLSQKH